MSARSISEGISQWNSKSPFPKDRYTLQVIEEKCEPSSGGNPMITRVLQIVAPEIAQLGENKINVAGLKVYQYLVCKVGDGNGGWDAEKSDASFGRLRDDLLLFDPSITQIDDENPPLVAKGKFVDAIVSGKPDKSYKAPTPEQIAKGQKVGEAIKDGNGKDIIVHRLQLDGGILAVVPAPSGMAF